MARIVQYQRTGPPEVLEVVEVPDPVPGADEVIVEVKAAGVNPLDWKLRSGVRPLSPDDAPYRPGFDGAGVVTAVGSDIVGVDPGDRVVIERANGTYASTLAVSTESLTPLPYPVSFQTGAALGIPVETAYQSLKSLGVASGMTLLIHGGSGCVGQAAIQLARQWGARVVATASQANHDRLVQLGAIAISYGDGLLERVRQAAPEGIDRVLDAAGTDEALTVSLQVVDDPQKVATIVQGAKAAELGIQAYSGGNPVPLTDAQQRLRRAAVPAVLPLIASGEFAVEIGATFALEDAAQAQRSSQDGRVRGKIVLLP